MRTSALDPIAEASKYSGGAYLQTVDWRCGDDELACADGQFHQRLIPEPFAYYVSRQGGAKGDGVRHRRGRSSRLPTIHLGL